MQRANLYSLLHYITDNEGVSVLMDKISIIVPVYNSANYLDECIEGLLSQTYQNIEIILVDDGSTDNSLQFCCNYQKRIPEIKVIHQDNGGASKARNTGLKAATGEFIAFCDSDDYVYPEWLETLYTAIKLNECDLACCNMERDGDSERTVENLENRKYEKSELWLLLREGLLNSLYTKLFCREIIETNNIEFDESFSNGEDLLFVLSYFKYMKYGFYFVNVKNYFYRTNNNSITHKYIKNYFFDTIIRYGFLKTISIECGCDWDKNRQDFYNLFIEACFFSISNNMRIDNISLFSRIAINWRELQSKECKKLIADLQIPKKGRMMNLLVFYTRVFIYQMKVVIYEFGKKSKKKPCN